MKKKDRETVFNKFGGKCSYCGEPLNKGWHCDHANPVERTYAYTGGGFYCKTTGRELTDQDFQENAMPNYEIRPRKLVKTGFRKPENDTIENMMPSCPSCNINKHGMNIEEFRAFIGRFITSLNRDSVQYKVAKRYGLLVETAKPVVFHFEKFVNDSVNQPA